MTDRLDEAVAAVRQMSAAEKDSIAHAMLSLVRIGRAADGDDIEPEHLAAVMEGMAQADRGEFVAGEADDIIARAFARARR